MTYQHLHDEWIPLESCLVNIVHELSAVQYRLGSKMDNAVQERLSESIAGITDRLRIAAKTIAQDIGEIRINEGDPMQACIAQPEQTECNSEK